MFTSAVPGVVYIPGYRAVPAGMRFADTRMSVTVDGPNLPVIGIISGIARQYDRPTL